MWSSGILRAAIIWNRASKWRKVSKCKRLVKQLQMHLTIQKNRRDAMVRQERIDISLLIQSGHLLQALPRVEKLHKDQSLSAAYEQLDHFCSCIITGISHVYKHKTVQDLPKNVAEAAASLVYAASRCGELPELRLLRDMLKEQYGWEFDMVNVELRPWNLVNSQLKEKLCINRIPDDVKQELISDLMKKINAQLALENSKSPTRQIYSFADRDFKYEQKAGGIQIQVPKPETKRKNAAGVFCSLSNGKLSVATPSQSHIASNTTTDVSVSSTKTNINAAQDPTRNMHRDIDSGVRNESTRTYAMTNFQMENSRGKLISSQVQNDHPSPGNAVAKDRSKVLAKRRHSYHGPVDENNMPKGSSPCSSHVHPKLPEYEDLVAKLQKLKAENRRYRRFSIF